MSVGVVDVRGVDTVLAFIIDLEGDLVSHQLRFNQVALVKYLGGPNVEPGVDKLADQKLDSLLLSVYDFADFKWCELIRTIFFLSWIFSLKKVERILVDLWCILTNLHLELVGIELHFLNLSIFRIDTNRNQGIIWFLVEGLAGHHACIRVAFISLPTKSILLASSSSTTSV